MAVLLATVPDALIWPTYVQSDTVSICAASELGKIEAAESPRRYGSWRPDVLAVARPIAARGLETIVNGDSPTTPPAKTRPGRQPGSAARTRVTRNGRPPGLHVKLQIGLGGGGRLGPGKIRLLEFIEAEGSLSRAAEVMGISYRRAWLFVQQINASFAQPAVATPEHGRGGAAARLTDFGRELIARYRALESHANDGGAGVLAWLDAHGRQD